MTNELINRGRGQRSWTPEQRAAAAQRCRERRPWTRSTGPRTAAGKARSSQNALRHGLRGAIGRRLFSLLREQRRYLMAVKRLAKSRTSPYKPPSSRIVEGNPARFDHWGAAPQTSFYCQVKRRI